MINQAREGEERGRGLPRSEEERQTRHEELYPGTPLPERGTGLRANPGTPAVGAVLGLSVVVGLALLAIKKA